MKRSRCLNCLFSATILHSKKLELVYCRSETVQNISPIDFYSQLLPPSSSKVSDWFGCKPASYRCSSKLYSFAEVDRLSFSGAIVMLRVGQAWFISDVVFCNCFEKACLSEHLAVGIQSSGYPMFRWKQHFRRVVVPFNRQGMVWRVGVREM